MFKLNKIILIIGFVFPLSNVSFSQLWKEMREDLSVNFYEVVEEAESYFETVDKLAKGSGWKGYQRWRYENEPKFAPSGDRSNIDPYFTSKAFEGFKANSFSAKALFNNGWEQLGPHYIEQVTGHYAVGLGRVETFYVDPNDANRVYLGSRSGGFWKTTDGGVTWNESSTDFLIASGVNTMTVSPTNPDSILINVRNAINGATHGIYRSIDAGDTWSVTNFEPSTLGWGGLGTNRSIYKIAYHPNISGQVFIGTQEGLYRSDDDMNSWTLVVPTLDFDYIDFHPTNDNIIYASASNNDGAIYVSTDGGQTFTTSNGLSSNSSNIKLSVSAACANCVYVGSSSGIWKSTDSGQNFTLLSQPGLSNFGAFAVNDLDTNYMLFGNIDVNMSSDEGTTFNQATFWSQGNANYNTTGTYVHADIRGAKCFNGVFWVNTDGMLCKSPDNGVTWQIYEGQSIRENYSLGVSQSNHERTITGSQDNGTSIRTENSWVEFYGADGMEGIIHPLNDDWMIGSLQNGGRRRTKDGGLSQTGVTPSGQNGSWVAPLFYDPNDHMVVYHVGDTLYRSDDFGSSWTKLGSPSFSGTISEALMAENNSDVIVVSRSSNIEISTDGGQTFTDIQGTLPSGSITDIAFDPNDDNTIIVVYGTHQNNSEKVYITNNQGLTWQNITYNLNDMPIRSVVIDHTDASTIYLGAEIGVYKKAMADLTWTLFNPDLPNMSVNEMEIMYGTNTLRAVTWGRGLWEYSLDNRQTFPAIQTTRITDQPAEDVPLFGVDQYVTSTITYDNTITSAYVGWSANAPTFGNVIPMTNTMDSTWVSNLPIPNQPGDTKVYFKVFAVGNSGDTTETYKFMYDVKPLDYCTSNGNMSWQTAVTLVELDSINNATGKTTPYTDYRPTDSTTLDLGSTHDLTINLNTDGNYTVYSRVWIDWNQDLDFSDPGEQYDLGSSNDTADGPTNLSPFSLTVPTTATVGETTMRVSARFGNYADSCETGFDGEVEDYRLIIEKVLVTDSTGITICSGDSLFLGGAWQNSTGIYIDTFVVSTTTDSIQTTNMTVLNSSSLSFVETSCDSYFWSVNGQSYNVSGIYSDTMTNSAGCDSIVTLDLNILSSSSSSVVETTCDSYFWPVNGQTYTTSGMYSETISNSAGCDSIVNLDLTVNALNLNVAQAGDDLMSEEVGASYQWISCPSMQIIPGATNPSYTATANGDYAVIVSKNGCVDTTACYSVFNVGINENSLGNNFLIYPNPTNGLITIELEDSHQEDVSISIIDMTGRIIYATEFKGTSFTVDVSSSADGTYILRASSANLGTEMKTIIINK